LDEIDALASDRSQKGEGGLAAMKMELLQEMQGK
jgi:ATP-dependent 26S proteasome regulatory subunit